MNISKGSFDSMADSAFDKLPEFIIDKCKNVEISIEDIPSGWIKEQYSHMTLFGVYVTHKPTPGKINFQFYGNLPDRVILYQDNIQAKCETEDQLQLMIRDVLIHEIGHHFGFTDKDLFGM